MRVLIFAIVKSSKLQQTEFVKTWLIIIDALIYKHTYWYMHIRYTYKLYNVTNCKMYAIKEVAFGCKTFEAKCYVKNYYTCTYTQSKYEIYTVILHLNRQAKTSHRFYSYSYNTTKPPSLLCLYHYSNTHRENITSIFTCTA